MKKRFRDLAALGLAAVMAAGSLTGCQKEQQPARTEAPTTQAAAEAGKQQESQGSGETEAAPLSGSLEIVTNGNEATFNAVTAIFQKFMEENPGVTIDFTTQGSDYEQLMKARMASNDLPDMFVTHGWSVARYSEYLRPLTDQPWYGTIEESFLSNIQDDNGDIFVLPLDMDQSGVIYNKRILEELDAEYPRTWDEFLSLCGRAKEKGYTGVFVAGKDSRQLASVMNISAVTYLINCEDKGYGQQLKDGTFDWNNWEPVSGLLMTLKENGYLNVDAVTCDPIDIPSRMAEDNVLFLITSSAYLISQAEELNGDIRYSLGPIPALNENYESAFCGGEREAYGIWKDTKNEELCLALLEYMARPENVRIVCEASGKRSAIKDVNPDLGAVGEAFKEYADVAIYPIFDRVYLPNGMWSTLKTVGSAIIGVEMTVEESIMVMEADYETLRAQN